MKVNELVEKINKDGKIPSTVAKKLIEIKYIPVMDKKKFVMDVIATCTDDVDNFIAVDRFKMNIYFDMRMVAAYTNLEIAHSFDDMIGQYDVLCEHGLLRQIIALFETEYSAMKLVLEDVLEELLVQNSIDMRVVKIANKISDLIDSIGDALGSFDVNSVLPEGTNIKELIDMFK